MHDIYDQARLLGVWLFVRKPFIMALACLKFILFSMVLLSVEALRKPGGVAGDPVPPQYPVVNVHVPEPSMGADDFKSAAIARRREQDDLLSLEEHIASMEKQTSATMVTLALQVQNVADMIESRMSA